jgi:hypothetical protein
VAVAYFWAHAPRSPVMRRAFWMSMRNGSLVRALLSASRSRRARAFIGGGCTHFSGVVKLYSY